MGTLDELREKLTFLFLKLARTWILSQVRRVLGTSGVEIPKLEALCCRLGDGLSGLVFS